MNKLYLFSIAIRFPNCFKSYLCNKNLISYYGGNYIIIDDQLPNIPSKANLYICKTDSKGLNELKYDINKNDTYYSEIALRDFRDYFLLTERGIELYKYSSLYYYCKTIDLKRILIEFKDTLSSVNTRQYRLPVEVFSSYLEVVEKNFEIKSKKDYQDHDLNWDHRCYMRAATGICKEQSIIYKAFMFDGLYTNLKWTFELVEKYKSLVDWKKLIEKSNLIWSEKKLEEYDSYVPYKQRHVKNCCVKQCDALYLKDYTNIENLSFTFLDKHKDDIYWPFYISSARIDWTSEEYSYFYSFYKNVCRTYIGYNSMAIEYGIDMASDFWGKLCSNKNVTLSKGLACLLLKENDSRLKYFLDYMKKTENEKSLFCDMILEDKELSQMLAETQTEILNRYNIKKKNQYKDCSRFLEKLQTNFDEINKIRTRQVWNKRYQEYFTCKYQMWDIYRKSDICLTYDICNLLINKNIFVVYGDSLKDVNALEFFCDNLGGYHEILDDKEYEKIIMDENITYKLLSIDYCDLIERIGDNLFQDKDVINLYLSTIKHLDI